MINFGSRPLSMNLRTLRDLLRPIVDLKAEYIVRRAAYSLIPNCPSETPNLVHACVWKTGSQWIRLILSDPRVFRHSGRKPYVWDKLSDGRIGPRSAILAAYEAPDEIYAIVPRTESRVFFVMRNPTDLFASWYVSTLITHPENPRVNELRALCEGLSEVDKVGVLLPVFEAESLGRIRAWIAEAERNAQVKLVRFEDLVGVQGHEHWRDLMAHLEIDIPNNELQRVLATYHISNLRKKGVTEDKYGKGGRTDLNFFEESESRRRIAQITAPLGVVLGYGAPATSSIGPG